MLRWAPGYTYTHYFRSSGARERAARRWCPGAHAGAAAWVREWGADIDTMRKWISGGPTLLRWAPGYTYTHYFRSSGARERAARRWCPGAHAGAAAWVREWGADIDTMRKWISGGPTLLRWAPGYTYTHYFRTSGARERAARRWCPGAHAGAAAWVREWGADIDAMRKWISGGPPCCDGPQGIPIRTTFVRAARVSAPRDAGVQALTPGR